MQVHRFDSADEVARAGAQLLAAEVAARAEPVLGLPTGRTVIPFYAELRRRHRDGELDLSRARAFNLDELCLPPRHPRGFRTFMEEHAWSRVGLDRARCTIPDPSLDPEKECRRYEARLAAAGGFDLAVLGIGEDGHVAYNLPGPPVAETHLVTLPGALADRLEVPEAWRPLQAITVGLGSFQSARSLLLLATGDSKARAVRAMVEGPEDPDSPASLLRDHPDFTVLLDRAAAAQLC